VISVKYGKELFRGYGQYDTCYQKNVERDSSLATFVEEENLS
jgi:hypothetical protein